VAIPFSRSVRSINHDRFLPNLIAISLICLTLVLWMVWFFAGELSIYSSSSDYETRSDGMLLVKFAPASLAQLRPGQQARLFLSPQESNASEPIRAEVMNVPSQADQPVEVYLFTSGVDIRGQKGIVKVLIGKTSPAQLVWNSIRN